jgi:hypothetical protein
MKALLLCACLCALALAACGGTSKRESPRARALAGAPHSKAYEASLAYARCMRAHGIAHPNPDANGDFELTPAQERRMRASSTPKEHEAADKACFRNLKGTVSTKPLSKAARKAALGPLRDLEQCLHGYGYDLGKPMVRNMSRGRAMFGFDRTPPQPPSGEAQQRLQKAQHTCEKKVHLAQRIDAIVKADRGEGY